MEHIIYIVILIIIGSLLSIPMIRKPLSEDDGNWFYLSVFWKNGVRLYKNLFQMYAYYGFHWIAAKIYNIFGFQKPSFFYFLKAGWYILNALSIYWLTFCFWHDHTLACVAGLLLIIITAVPNTLFVLTYAEHFHILPINLSIIFTYYGLTIGNPLYFMLAGLMAGWAVQIKPTALLFGILLPIVFFFTPNMYLSLGSYIIAFIGFNLFPLIVLCTYNMEAPKQYFILTFGPIMNLLSFFLRKIKLNFLDKYRPESMKTNNHYISHHHNLSIKTQWLALKRFMLPAIKDLYFILILASLQILFMFIKFDPFSFSMILLFIILLLIQQFQKNYYTPHFNTCWAPISILAAKTISDMWPYLLNSGVLGWTMIVFLAFELTRIGSIIIKTFSECERDTFGHLDPLVGKVFRLCESVGKYIQENSKENEKLFVWGDQPSLYLYARREAFDTKSLFLYAHHEQILREKEIIESLREKPPELLIFYNYKVLDSWNIKRLQETIGIPFKFMRGFQVTDDSRRNDKNPQGICFDFPLYRRDDEKYKEILLDRALIAKLRDDINGYQKHLESILEISQGDYETSIRLSLLNQNIVGSKTERSYLKEKLSENHDSIKNAILLRLLAEIDIDAGNLDSAIKNYEKALDSNLNDFRVYNGLGELSFSMDRIDDAFEYFKKAIVLHPYSSDVLNNIGVLLSQSGKRDNAMKYFQKALSFMPSHPDARKNMDALT